MVWADNPERFANSPIFMQTCLSSRRQGSYRFEHTLSQALSSRSADSGDPCVGSMVFEAQLPPAGATPALVSADPWPSRRSDAINPQGVGVTLTVHLIGTLPQLGGSCVGSIPTGALGHS